LYSLRTLSTRILTLGIAAVLVCSAGAAMAGSVTYGGGVSLATTNWSSSITFPKFNSTLGCLDSVCFSLDGHVEGTAKFESLDSGPTTVMMNLAATLTLQRPDLSTLVVTLPVASTTDNVTAFDGVVDFGGTSGRTHLGLSANSADGRCSSTLSDIALFTGSGSIVLPCVATGSSNGSGAGNLILQFQTLASAGANVTYWYSQCATPTKPTTWGALKSHYR
jgi:hypothetical protein